MFLVHDVLVFLLHRRLLRLLHPPLWNTADAEIKAPSVENPEQTKCSPFNKNLDSVCQVTAGTSVQTKIEVNLPHGDDASNQGHGNVIRHGA